MKRPKRILKWAEILAAVVVAILLVANAVLVGITGSRLQRRIEAIRAAGEPLSLAELAPAEPVPPEENAAVFIRRAQQGAVGITGDLSGVKGVDGQPLDESDGVGYGRLAPSEQKALRSIPSRASRW